MGFLLGLALGLVGHCDWSLTLWRSCAAALALGWLMRWWSRVWLRGLQVSLYERRLAEAMMRQQAQSPTPPKK